MDRRTFLALGLAAPLAFKSGLVSPKWAFSAEDNAIEVSFAADPSAPKVTLWQTPRQSHSQMMGYIFRTETGETVVFDGGMPADAKYLTALLQKHCGGKVDAWYLTHAHGDHFGALGEILEKTPDALEIKKLYFNFPNRAWLDKYEKGGGRWRDPFFAAVEKNFKGEIVAPQPGDVQTFGDALKIETLNDFDESLTMNAINNSTIIFRLDVAGKSLLMLGDLGLEGGNRVLKNVPKEKIDADFVQMAHHGQQGVSKEFYAVASPTVCLWPTPDWLWDNNSGKGKNSGPWKTLEVRAWMEELGVDKHYVSKDGLIKMTF